MKRTCVLIWGHHRRGELGRWCLCSYPLRELNFKTDIVDGCSGKEKKAGWVSRPLRREDKGKEATLIEHPLYAIDSTGHIYIFYFICHSNPQGIRWGKVKSLAVKSHSRYVVEPEFKLGPPLILSWCSFHYIDLVDFWRRSSLEGWPGTKWLPGGGS